MYACMYTLIHVYTCSCNHSFTYANALSSCIAIHTYTRLHAYIHTHTLHTHALTRSQTSGAAVAHVHAYIHTDTHITDTCTHSFPDVRFLFLALSAAVAHVQTKRQSVLPAQSRSELVYVERPKATAEVWVSQREEIRMQMARIWVSQRDQDANGQNLSQSAWRDQDANGQNLSCSARRDKACKQILLSCYA
jgi:hypothetical protein